MAVEYAWQHADDYNALLFITADSPEALDRGLAELCGPMILDLPEHAKPEQEPRVAAAVRWLQKNPGWFLILDNLDSEEAVRAAEKLLSKLAGGHAVLTSRISNFGPDIEPLGVGRAV